MSSIAFHGDPAVKARAIERLRRHVEGGTFVYYPAWENGNANAIGAVVEADDTPLYAERLGYPIALAETLPVFANGVRPLGAAAQFAEAWLERTPVGADLGRVPSQIILELLDQPELVARTRVHPRVEQARQAIVALHARAVAGDAPDRKAWKAARLAAIAATDDIVGAPLERQAGGVVEAAAWPGTMRTVLRDTIHGYGALDLRLRLAEMNWTEEEESRVFHIREQAERDGFKDQFTGLTRLYAILDADHPELGNRFRMRSGCMEKSAALYRSFGWRTVELMENAPLSLASAVPAL